jgi:circadian clock protein KaiC
MKKKLTQTNNKKPSLSNEAADLQDQPIVKVATGIKGFDEISLGGLPASRLTAILGNPGAGKTVFALQTLVNRVKATGEAGIFVTFEEPIGHIRRNVASFDWNLPQYNESQLRFIDARVSVDTIHTGAFDLTGLLAGLTAIKEETGIKHIVFDGIDMLLSALEDELLERRELSRIDNWVRSAGMSAIITVKSQALGERDQTRGDFLQYITDCVVVLNSMITETSSSRTLRIAKYRGSDFVANPVPVVIGQSGFDVISFKTTRISYPTFDTRVSSGVPRLDTLLNGGYIRGSSVLISGAPGTSKTSLCASFAAAACANGQKALFVSFDESSAQITANMNSIGLDLKKHIKSGKLVMESFISVGRSPEEYFLMISGLLERHSPEYLVIDPLSSLLKADYPFSEIIPENILDQAKSRGITTMCTSLLEQVSGEQEISASRVSTIADTWIHVSYIANDGERNRALTIIKSRGTAHSNQVRELVLNEKGIDLFDVYIAEGEVLLGSARAQKEADIRRKELLIEIEYERQRLKLNADLAELEAALHKASEELKWKRQETEFLERAELTRTQGRAAAAKERLELRGSDEDTHTLFPPARPKRKVR